MTEPGAESSGFLENIFNRFGGAESQEAKQIARYQKIVDNAALIKGQIEVGEQDYKGWVDGELTSIREGLSEEYKTDERIGELKDRYLTMSLVVGSEEYGFDMKKSQVMGADLMIGGKFVEMKPGEGKTFSLAMAAGWDVLNGRQVQIQTDKAINVWAGIESMTKFYQRLGVTEVYGVDSHGKIGRTADGRGIDTINKEGFEFVSTYEAFNRGNIVYTEYPTVAHQFLRDDGFGELASRDEHFKQLQAKNPELAKAFLEQPYLVKAFLDNPNNRIYLDEADKVFADSPCVISGLLEVFGKEEWEKIELPMKVIWEALNRPKETYSNTIQEIFQPWFEEGAATDEHAGYYEVRNDGEVLLGAAAYDCLAYLILLDPNRAQIKDLFEKEGLVFEENESFEDSGKKVSDWLATQTDLVMTAFKVTFGFKENQHYLVERDGDGKPTKVVLIDSGSGTEQHQRQYSDLEQQCLYLKTGLPVEPPKITENSILYPLLLNTTAVQVAGCSGTLEYQSALISRYLHEAEVVPIEPEGIGVVQTEKTQVYSTPEGKQTAVARLVAEEIRQGKSVMVYERDHKQAEAINKLLVELGVEEMAVLNAASEGDVDGVLMTFSKEGAMISQLDPRGMNLPFKEDGLIIFSGMNPMAKAFDEQVMARLGGNRPSGRVIRILGPDDLYTFLDNNEKQRLRKLIDSGNASDGLLADKAGEEVEKIYERVQRRNLLQTQDVTRFRMARDKVMRSLHDGIKEVMMTRNVSATDELLRLWSDVLDIAPHINMQVFQEFPSKSNTIEEQYIELVMGTLTLRLEEAIRGEAKARGLSFLEDYGNNVN